MYKSSLYKGHCKKTVNLPTGFDVWPFLQIYKIYLKSNFHANGDTHWTNKGRSIIYKLSSCHQDLMCWTKYPSTQKYEPLLFCHIVWGREKMSFGFDFNYAAFYMPLTATVRHGGFWWFSNWSFESQWESLSRLLWPLTLPWVSINAGERGLILTLSLAFSKGPPRVHSQIFQSPS